MSEYAPPPKYREVKRQDVLVGHYWVRHRSLWYRFRFWPDGYYTAWTEAEWPGPPTYIGWVKREGGRYTFTEWRYIPGDREEPLRGIGSYTLENDEIEFRKVDDDDTSKRKGG